MRKGRERREGWGEGKEDGAREGEKRREGRGRGGEGGFCFLHIQASRIPSPTVNCKRLPW